MLTARKHIRTLRQIDIKLTDVCNVNCIMCGQRVRKEGVLAKNFVKLDSLKSFFDAVPAGLQVYLWGGEPLIHPDFQGIANFFIEKECDISVNTNGYFLNNHMDFLTTQRLRTLVISFDGIGPIHDRIRRQNGLYDKAKDGLMDYMARTRGQSLKRSVVVNFTVIPENYLIMERFCEEVSRWGVNSVTINLPILVNPQAGEEFSERCFEQTRRKPVSWRGYAQEYHEAFDYSKFAAICNRLVNRYGHFIRWSNENLALTEKNLRLYYERTDQPLPALRKMSWDPSNAPCAMLTRGLAIDATGKVVSCPDFPDTSIGHIEHNQLTDFFGAEKYQLFDLFDQVSPMCLRCPHRK